MLVAFSVAPSGGDPSVGGTRLMDVVTRATEAVAPKARRTSLVHKADIRPGHVDMLHAEVRRVEDALAGDQE